MHGLRILVFYILIVVTKLRACFVVQHWLADATKPGPIVRGMANASQGCLIPQSQHELLGRLFWTCI
jgi:hypothetical protein